MMAMRDPEETQPHVNRVGSYSVEIYKRWGVAHDVPKAEVDAFKDILQMSAMLHDIGKIGIPDAILRKPGPLDEAERETMKLHVLLGACYSRTRTRSGTPWLGKFPSTTTRNGTARDIRARSPT